MIGAFRGVVGTAIVVRIAAVGVSVEISSRFQCRAEFG